ncbi:hypothetical protein O1D97_17500 [Marinomonas sp. 15G1-11]|uniref:Pilus formation protein N-terminal domain-containing protein n=1 Tax=Marinomonas phaeophyticola TaxID=3004091 RepID=A0ABT4JY87_9GAMM|nr:hypothetical protein [Marinomonas sp. 15G1-11]MCZ2723353.1 hypothetical protein [Marinomonas sp. 15G1-11]
MLSLLLGALSVSHAFSQEIQIREVDVIYGNQVIRGKHQIVFSSPPEVGIVPAEKTQVVNLGPNVIIGSQEDSRSYLEVSKIAAREQEIYNEVNRRTEEAPFTVLFTGNIPAEIQAKRLQLMPEVGVFGDQLNKLEKDQAASQVTESQDEVYIPENIPGVQVFGTDEAAEDKTDEALLEKLIGG